MIYFWTTQTPIGTLTLAEKNKALAWVSFFTPDFSEETCQMKTAFLEKVEQQLTEYFSGKRKNFNLPLWVEGTDFQQKVWDELQKIPYGETISYGELARRCGNPKACRAVGMANNKNRIAIIIPCHRVIGINGKLVGYAGGLDIKSKLLDLEYSKKGAE